MCTDLQAYLDDRCGNITLIHLYTAKVLHTTREQLINVCRRTLLAQSTVVAAHFVAQIIVEQSSHQTMQRGEFVGHEIDHHLYRLRLSSFQPIAAVNGTVHHETEVLPRESHELTQESLCWLIECRGEILHADSEVKSRLIGQLQQHGQRGLDLRQCLAEFETNLAQQQQAAHMSNMSAVSTVYLPSTGALTARLWYPFPRISAMNCEWRCVQYVVTYREHDTCRVQK